MDRLIIVWGTDSLLVREQVQEILQSWQQEWPDAEVEQIEPQGDRVDQFLPALQRLRNAFGALSLFATRRIVVFQAGPLFASGGPLQSEPVAKEWTFCLEALKRAESDLRLLVSAIKPDRRLQAWKQLVERGKEIPVQGLDPSAPDWEEQAARFVRQRLRREGKQIEEEALVLLVEWTGPDAAALRQEIEKLIIYVGEEKTITKSEVEAVVTRSHYARAFALAEAVGQRDVAAALKALEEELWQIQFQPKKSPIGLLYGLISKIRTLLQVKLLLQQGLLRPPRFYGDLEAQLKQLPQELLPEDRRWNPIRMHPYALRKAIEQTRHYRLDELLDAMKLLLDANLRLVTTAQNPNFILRNTIIQILTPNREGTEMRHDSIIIS